MLAGAEGAEAALQGRLGGGVQGGAVACWACAAPAQAISAAAMILLNIRIADHFRLSAGMRDGTLRAGPTWSAHLRNAPL